MHEYFFNFLCRNICFFPRMEYNIRKTGEMVVDFFDDAHAQREHGIDPGGNAADVSPADEEFMAYGFGVFRIFLDPAAQHFGHSHDIIISIVS